MNNLIPPNTCATWAEEDWIDSDGHPTSEEKRIERFIEELSEHLESVGWWAIVESSL